MKITLYDSDDDFIVDGKKKKIVKKFSIINKKTKPSIAPELTVDRTQVCPICTQTIF